MQGAAAGSAEYNKRGNILKTRIISAAVGLVLLSIVMYFFNTPVLDVAVALLSAVAVHEFVHAAGLSEHKLLEAVCLIFGVAFSTVYFNIFSGITFLAELLFAGILMIMLLFDHKELEVGKIAFAFMASSLVPRAFSMLLLYREYDKPVSYYLVGLSLCVAWLNDIFAYFSGYFFGKKKLCPEISPKKTVEGAIGGVAGDLILCLALTYAFSAAANLQVNWLSLCIFLPIGAVASIFGDLCASIVKRQYGIKDYGNIMPGHGGVMDRFDSWVFVAPLLYIWNIYLPFIG